MDSRNDTIPRGKQIAIFLDGKTVQALEGETVAAALLAAGFRRLRVTAKRGEPRGMYCGIGSCFDCLITLDGVPNIRACQTVARHGMQIRRQSGSGMWRL